MWKMKTQKSVAKRFKVSKRGKLLHSKTCKSHLLTKKGKTTKKQKYGQEIAKVEYRRMARMISCKMR